MVYAEAAVDCVRWIRGDADSETGDLSINEASIAAALTAILHNSRFIEDATTSCANLGNISMLVCVRGWRPSNSSSLSPPARTFKLWGPPLTSRPFLDPRGNVINVNSDAALRTNANTNIRPPNDVNKAPSGRQGVHPPRYGAGINGSSPPSNALPSISPATDNGNQATEVYAIPQQVSLQCLSLLLDGMGATSHSTATRDLGYMDINTRELEILVQDLHKKESERLMLLQERPPHINGQTTDSNRHDSDEDSAQHPPSATKCLKYSSLVPVHIRDQVVSLPIVRVISNNTAKSNVMIKK